MKDKISYYLSPWLNLLLFIVLIIIMALPLMSVLQTSPVKDILANIKSPLSTFFDEIALFIITLTAVAVLIGFSKQKSWLNMFYREEVAVSGFIKGTLLGALVIIIISGVLMTLGYVDFQYTSLPYQNMAPLAIVFIAVALFEEFLFRSYILNNFAERYPFILTLLINGLLFAIAHLGNDNYTILGFVNIALAGALLSLMVMEKWNIGWGIGLHFGWNTMQGAILGYPVSGLSSKGTFVTKLSGPEYISGGKFGIEGSIVCTVVFLALLIGLFYYYKIHPLAVIEDIQELEEETKSDNSI